MVEKMRSDSEIVFLPVASFVMHFLRSFQTTFCKLQTTCLSPFPRFIGSECLSGWEEYPVCYM